MTTGMNPELQEPMTMKTLLILIGKLVPMTMPPGVIGVRATLLAPVAGMTTGMNPELQVQVQMTTGTIPQQLLKSLHPSLLSRMSAGKVLLMTLQQLLEIGLHPQLPTLALALPRQADGKQ